MTVKLLQEGVPCFSPCRAAFTSLPAPQNMAQGGLDNLALSREAAGTINTLYFCQALGSVLQQIPSNLRNEKQKKAGKKA